MAAILACAVGTARGAVATEIVETAGAAGPLPARASDWQDRVSVMEGHRRGPMVSAWLRNNVRFHYMKMDLPPGAVSATVNFLGGVMKEDGGSRGISLAAVSAWNGLSIRDLGSAELGEAIGVRNVHFEGWASPEALTLRVWGSREDIETGMQVATLMMTRPLVTAEGVQKAAEGAAEVEAGARTLRGRIARGLTGAMFPPEETRTRPAKREEVAAVSVERAQAWLDDHLQNAPIEVSIVGDLPLEQALQLAGGYIGTLPERRRTAPGVLEEFPRVAPPKFPIVVEPDRTAPIGDDREALVLVGFRGPDIASTRDIRALRVAGEALDDRVTQALKFAGVLDVEGESKSAKAKGTGQAADEARKVPVGVSVVPGSPYPGFGAVVVSCRVKANRAFRAAEVVEREIAAAGSLVRLRPEEVTSARNELAERAERWDMDPKYWSNVLAKATTIGLDIDEAADGAGFYRELTADGLVDANKAVIHEGVNDVLRRYIGAGRSIRIILPLEPGEIED